MFSCSTDDSEYYNSDLSEADPGPIISPDSTFDASWETAPNTNDILEAEVRMTADSIIISPFPDEQIMIEAFGYAEHLDMTAIDPRPYAIKYVIKGYSQTMIVYSLDADDYSLTVERPDGQRHIITARFAFDSQASFDKHWNLFMLKLKLKAIYVDKEQVTDNPRIPGLTFTLYKENFK